jgi:5,10-methylenetetrahydromethanopterin reductase
MTLRIGAMLPSRLPIGPILELARHAEEVGLDEVWVVEDCFNCGGVATAALVLAHTSHISVGIGILPAMARNAAFIAMDLATLETAYPGRLIPGLGHGSADWMRQIGAYPSSPLAALGETISAVRLLLGGGPVTVAGRYVHLDAVQLDMPPTRRPPVLAGVRGPKSLELSGRVADGTILAEPSAPSYVRYARAQIDAGRAAVGRTDHHQIVAFNVFARSTDDRAALDIVEPMLRRILDPSTNASQLGVLPFGGELLEVLEQSALDGTQPALKDEWLRELAIVGTPSECASRMAELAAAGADACVVFPPEGIVEIDTVTRAGEVARLVRAAEGRGQAPCGR